MSYVKFGPFGFAPKQNNKTNNFGHLINDFFNHNIGDIMGSDFATKTPAANVVELENGYELSLAAPGFEKSDFKVKVENNTLTISVEKEAAKEDEVKPKYTRREFAYGSFTRSFTLPKSTDTDAISAKYVNGVLALTIPKKVEEKASASTIEIS